jgi:glycerol-3-phosphate dehydrogenase
MTERTTVPQALSRDERITRGTTEQFDVIIIGGGIHGACVAKLAAREKLKVLLLEKNDYASGTSSRSSKMAHGGLRYLEMCDFEQVFEGIKAREALFTHCPNLVAPKRFLIPVPRNAWWLRLKLSVGLMLYDLMVSHPSRKHRWVPRRLLPYTTFHSSRSDLMGCFEYTDGLMNDTRLVLECIVAASRYGATCLNYAPVVAIRQASSQAPTVVEWKDVLTNTTYTARSKLVVNCTGPWANHFTDRTASPEVRYSRGSHLLFSEQWRDPSLFLPLDQKGRYYFVWPHEHGTLVGTTEREVTQLEDDPQPSQDEVEEILTRVKRDLPNSTLTRETLVYAFAGVRTLPVRKSKKGVSQLSRKHMWRWEGSVLSLFGGKFTTFAWTASEGVTQILARLGRVASPSDSLVADLPSSISEKTRQEVQARILAERPNVPEAALTRALSRLGNQVLLYLSKDDAWSEIAPGVLRLELLHALMVEHAETLDDIIRRRLDLEASPSHGNASVAEIVRQLSPHLTTEALKDQEAARLERLGKLYKVLGT